MSSAGGGLVLSGPGQACLDALRCASFLVQQHPRDLREAFDTLASSASMVTGEDPGVLSWLEPLAGAVQSLLGGAPASGASSRRRRRKKRRRKEQGQAGEEEQQSEEGEDEKEETASEEEEGGEEAGRALRSESVSGGRPIAGQQLQQGGAAAAVRGNGRSVDDPAAPSVSASARPRADLVISGSSRRGDRAVRRAAAAEALGSGDVVGSIFSFLVGVGEASTGRQSVRQLGQLGLVCRKWREVSMWEAWWSDAAEEMLPAVVWGVGAGGGGGGRRRRVLEHGRVVGCERRVWFGEWGWMRGLSVHFEVFDRMDGLQMLSVRGPLGAFPIEEGQTVWMGIASGHRWEVVGRPFSAASRDPEQRRFQSMRDFFERGHDAGFASSVCARVSVADERTGRRALLWEEEGKETDRATYELSNAMHPWVGEGGFAVATITQEVVTCGAYSGPRLYGRVGFSVRPVAGQAEGVSEQDRLYQLAGGDEQNYEQHPSFIQLDILDGDYLDPNKPPVDVGALGRFVRCVLGMGR